MEGREGRVKSCEKSPSENFGGAAGRCYCAVSKVMGSLVEECNKVMRCAGKATETRKKSGACKESGRGGLEGGR